MRLVEADQLSLTDAVSPLVNLALQNFDTNLTLEEVCTFAVL